jgi:hypothetical protein
MDLPSLGRLKNVSRNALLRLVKAGGTAYSVDETVVKVRSSDFDAYVAANGHPR